MLLYIYVLFGGGFCPKHQAIPRNHLSPSEHGWGRRGNETPNPGSVIALLYQLSVTESVSLVSA